MNVDGKPKLLDQLRNRVCTKGYSRSTESTYVHWVRRYILFHGKQHPSQLDDSAVEAFLTHIAVHERVSASAQNQAFSALVFFYKEVLNQPLGPGLSAVRAKQRQHIPTVLSVEEVCSLLDHMEGTPKLMAELVYGSGMRVGEVHRLRVLHLDFAALRVRVHDGKGHKDRLTLLPAALLNSLQSHITSVRTLHAQDLEAGFGRSVLPKAYAQRRDIGSRDFHWQFVFPSASRFQDVKTGVSGRWHMHPSVLQRAVRIAAFQAGIRKRVTVHTLRHCFATHMLQNGCNIRTIQSLMGHKDLNTTMIYTHIVENHQLTSASPLDVMRGGLRRECVGA